MFNGLFFKFLVKRKKTVQTEKLDRNKWLDLMFFLFILDGGCEFMIIPESC